MKNFDSLLISLGESFKSAFHFFWIFETFQSSGDFWNSTFDHSNPKLKSANMKTVSELKVYCIKVLKILWQNGRDHSKGFEMIVENSGVIDEIQQRKITKQFIFPFLLPLYLSLDSLYYLFTVGYDPEEENPILFHHKIASPLPILFRKQADAVYIAAYPFSMISYYFLIFDRMNHVTLCLFPSPEDSKILCSINGKTINQDLSNSLLAFQSKINTKLETYFRFMELESHLGSTFSLLAYEIYKMFSFDEYQTEFRNWWTVILFLFYVHQFMFLLQIGFSFVIVNMQFHIKQRYFLETVQFKSYLGYVRVSKTLLEHTKEIDKWSNFYKGYTSGMIAFNCFIGCSALSSLQDAQNIPMIIKTEWMFFVLFFLSFICMLTAISSKTIQLNRALFLKLRSLQTTICDLRIIQYRRQIIHLDLMNEYKALLLRTCFRFVNSSQLCNKFGIFNIFGFLMFVYMKVYQHR